MDNSYQVDTAAMFGAIRAHDHLVFRFQTIPLRLFVDFRTSETQGPGAYVLPQAASFRERMDTILQVRPDFPRLKRINVVPWPLRVGSLERLGVIERLRERLGDMDGFETLRDLDAAMRELEAAERHELRRAITGEGYKTLWTTPAR